MGESEGVVAEEELCGEEGQGGGGLGQASPPACHMARLGREEGGGRRWMRRARRRKYLADTVLGTASLQGAAGLLAGQLTVSGAE